MLQTQISPHVLDELNLLYPWLPNSSTCRPSHANLVEKKALLYTTTHLDLVKNMFGDETGWIFKPTNFRYNIPETTNHWILWNTDFDMGWKPDPTEINEVLYTYLHANTHNAKSDSFDFAWYINPKPTVSQYFHVQVFWIKT